MQCQEVRDRLADYLSGDLAASDETELQEHIASCAACQAETEALEDVWARLDEIPAEQMGTTAMRLRFDEMLDAYQHGLHHGRSSGAWTGVWPDVRKDVRKDVWNAVNAWMAQWWPKWPVLQVGLAAVLLVVGLLAGRSVGTPAPRPDPDLTALRQELQDVRQMFMLSLMQQPSATERLRGVSSSNRIDQPGNEVVSALLDTLTHDPNVNVRLAAVDALRRFSERAVVRNGTVRALADASSPLLQIALIDFIVETKDTEAAAALQRLSEDSAVNEAVRDRAVWGLERLKS